MEHLDALRQPRLSNEPPRNRNDTFELEHRRTQIRARLAGADRNIPRPTADIGQAAEAGKLVLAGKLATVHHAERMQTAEERLQRRVVHRSEVVLRYRSILTNGLRCAECRAVQVGIELVVATDV